MNCLALQGRQSIFIATFQWFSHPTGNADKLALPNIISSSNVVLEAVGEVASAACSVSYLKRGIRTDELISDFVDQEGPVQLSWVDVACFIAVDGSGIDCGRHGRGAVVVGEEYDVDGWTGISLLESLS